MILILFVLILLSFLIYKRHQQMSIIKRLEIPGPKPNFLFGNTLDIAREGFVGMFPKWTKKYGSVVGFYVGGLPQVLITDLEMIRHVTIKDFKLFSIRNQYIPGGIHPQPQLQSMLVWQQGNAWKCLRDSMSSSFTSSKLNEMEPLMMMSIKHLVNELDVKANHGQEFAMRPLISEMTFASSMKCIFGINLSLHHASKEVQSLLQSSQPRLEKSVLAVAMLLFPSLNFICHPLRIWWETTRLHMLWSPEGIVYDLAKRILQVRRNAEHKSSDFMQLLMDTNLHQSTSEMDLEMTLERLDNKQAPLSKVDFCEPISDEEILSNAMLFLIAGYETVSTTLQFTIHNLVNHQDVQEKLRNELKIAINQNGGEANFKIVSQVPLLINVIKETLRMFPPVSPATSRVAETDYEYKGLRIPKGVGVFIGVAAIHNNPQFWPEPEKFRPERFDSAIDKMTYLPFGAGLRNCIGMRFGYMELQLALANMLLQYKFEPGPSTERNITTTETYGSLIPKYGVFCKVIRLEQ